MSKVILKNTPLAAAVKCYGASAETIALATDLLRAGQTADTPKVNINKVMWVIPTGGAATIVRNSKTLYSMGPGAGEIAFESFTDNEENTANIVVTITGGGTVFLDLHKTDGYGDAQHVNPT